MYNLKCIYYYLKPLDVKKLDENEMELAFGEKIELKIPTMIGRMGATESSTIIAELMGSRKRKEKMCEQLCRWSGFFPNNIDFLRRFSKEYLCALKEVDYIHLLNEKWDFYLVKKYCEKKISYIENPGVWAAENPWSKHLKNKKVLVIHPFEESIRKQYKIHEKLFQNPDMLPDFELKTIKAVQTIAGNADERFQTWFEALEWMKKQMDLCDYDVALIGCGAYGFPLAAHAKRMGKIGIHMGGDLQMLFGIWGSRWNTNVKALQLRNEYWTNPLENEKPMKCQCVEGGCYW